VHWWALAGKAAAAAVLSSVLLLSKDRNEGETDSLGEMLLADLITIFKETGQDQLISKRAAGIFAASATAIYDAYLTTWHLSLHFDKGASKSTGTLL
jgi:hypothetical protein